MKTLYALSGPSGAGKTFRRLNDPKLKDLPSFDVADIYAENSDIDPQRAFTMLLEKIVPVLEKGDSFVVEAYFKEGSFQRKWIEHYSEYHGYNLVYIEFDTPLEVCMERVKKDYEDRKDLCKDNHERARLEKYTTARLFLLQNLLRERDYRARLELAHQRHR